MAVFTTDASPKVHFIALLFVATTVISSLPFLLTDTAYSTQSPGVGFAVTVVPSSVVVRVGEQVGINVNVTNAEGPPMGQVCFSLQGFPDSGFRTSFLPECVTSQSNTVAAILTVEVTAAAAPQSFTAFVIARSNGRTAQTLWV